MRAKWEGGVIMTRVTPIIMAASLIIVAGCRHPRASYQSEVRVTPMDKPGVYEVAFEVSKSVPGEKPVTIGSPRLTVSEGKKGVLTVETEDGALVVDAVVTPHGETRRATIGVQLKKNGESVWYRTRTFTITE